VVQRAVSRARACRRGIAWVGAGGCWNNEVSPPTTAPPPLPPPPTQHVLVDFPPELVDKFAPHGWLTGPVATLLAAGVALIAAAIAFFAVNRQIKANASVVAAQIAADRSERRRAERIDLATDGVTLVTDLARIAFNHEHYSGETGGSPSPNQQQFGLRKVLWARGSGDDPADDAPGHADVIRGCRGGL
jgi:hypothetical protein